ncbi:MAG TPA: endolytic transglycosylase MltG [Gaiellaceae bacterium]|nr:endolytic transglycosylase MltG [Gaiellaceae bacterium]
MKKPRGPSPEQIRRRRIAALIGVVAALIAVVVAVVVALPHVHASNPATPTVAPQPKPFKVVFPEGFTRTQMIKRVQDVAKIAARKKGRPVALSGTQYALATKRAVVPCFTPRRQTNLEGFLFPATYDFLATTPSRELVSAQLQAFCDNWTSINLSYARKKNLTPYDVLIIASMIEREALAPEDRPLVSAVIYNRLHAHMTLGIDATLRYGLKIPSTQSILQSQLESNNPYNTRKLQGLPPTPIANPGLASIQAAAHPAHVNYLYFVRKPDLVHHYFTASGSAFAHYLCAHGYGC